MDRFYLHNILFNKVEWSDLTSFMATKRRVLIAFQGKSFVVLIEILFFPLAIGADLPLSNSMAINCLK